MAESWQQQQEEQQPEDQVGRGDSGSRSRSRSPTRRRRLHSKRVVLVNLPYHATTAKLRTLFKERLGFVGYVQLLEEHGRPSGIGYVDFKTFEGAEEAIQKMHGVEIDGRKLLVREERQQDRERIDRAMLTGPAPPPPDCLSPAVLQQLGIDGPVTNSVFVGNLDYTVSWQKLKDVFRLAGRVLKADILTDREGKSKGVGVVKFETPIEAVQAISMLHGQTLFGRPMNVRMDFGPGAGHAGGRPAAPVLPEGLGGVGMGLGVGGAPARSIEEVGVGVGVGMGAPPAGYGFIGDAGAGFGYAAEAQGYQRQQAAHKPSGGYRPEFSVVVTNLPTAYGWIQLKRAFRDIGEVRYADVLPDRRGIVKFGSIVEAKRAATRMDGANVDGCRIRVALE